jgi:hypothetical protein
MMLQLKIATGIIHSQCMAPIKLTVIGCIDYLAYGTIFMHAMFCQKNNLEVFFPAKKPKMSAGRCWASNGPNNDDSDG